MSFSAYYQSELAYYRSLAQEYARAFPEVSHMVGERGSDTAVERVLQGAALLTGRLRFRVDDDLPEVIQGLFLRMWPQHLTPLPAVTMLRLRNKGGVSSCHTLAPGIRVQSRPLPGSLPLEATFQTSGKVDVQPITLREAAFDPAHPADLQLKLRFTTIGGASFAGCGLERLRLQLLGERPIRYALYLWLSRYVQRVSLRDEAGVTRIALPGRAVKPGGLAADEPLIPYQPTPLPGYRTLWEYFVCPDKFLAVELGPFAIPKGAFSGGSLELVFHLGTPPGTRPQISKENFAIGCTPALNIGGEQLLELPVAPGATSFVVNAPRSGEVFSIDRVGCSHRDTGQWLEFIPYFSPGRLRLADDRPCYQVLRLADGPEGARVYLQITGSQGEPLAPPAPQLRVWLTQTDGSMPMRLAPGTVCVPTADSPEYVAIDQVGPILPGEPLQVGQDRRWELLAQLTMHPADLASEVGLNALLRSAAPERVGDPPEVVDVQSHMTGMVHKRTMVPVRVVVIDVADGSFEGSGELALFATVLNELFARNFDSTVFNQVAVRGRSSGLTFKFTPH